MIFEAHSSRGAPSANFSGCVTMIIRMVNVPQLRNHENAIR